MRLVAAAIVAPLVLATFAPAAMAACSCAKQTRDQVVAKASLVFTGRMLSTRRDGANNFARVETVQLLKGSAQPVVEVMTPASAAACGYEFPSGQVVAVAATLRQQQYETDS
ncbi:MAG: Tissue inhibitor of metalloproteinase, partial [Hyphomicrobiales bacterium]|nr:Tissue inhibitor of metalloproteinase [Hyphomicrobiales bacterium]